jgi:hypothetical protein
MKYVTSKSSASLELSIILVMLCCSSVSTVAPVERGTAEPITEAELREISGEALRSRLARSGGLPPASRAAIWLQLLGLEPWSSREDECKQRAREAEEEYAQFCKGTSEVELSMIRTIDADGALAALPAVLVR